MEETNLLIPAIIAFSLLIIGLGLTIYEFYTQRNIGPDPVDHTPRRVRSRVEQTG